MKNHYNCILKTPTDQFGVIVQEVGKETEFRALYRVQFDAETGMWDGFLIFKDQRFSPCDAITPELQFCYQTPSAGNGVLAAQRAERMWVVLKAVFADLMQSGKEK